MVIQLDFFSAIQASSIMRKKKHVKFINNIVRNNYKTINNQTSIFKKETIILLASRL